VKRPLAPSLPAADPSAPADPIRAFAERRKAAIDSRLAEPQRVATEAAGVDGAATRPKPTTSTSDASAKPSTVGSANSGADTPKPSAAKEPPSSEASSTPSKSSEPEATSTTTPETSADTSSSRGPRYDVKSFKRWAEANPEEALEFASQIKVDVFREGEDPKQEWIRQQSKARKLKEEIRTQREAATAEIAAQHAAVKADRDHAEMVAGKLAYLGEMWAGATRKDTHGNPQPDFDTVDEAFRGLTQGMTIDDYNRLRARRGASNPEVARLRAENARLVKLLPSGQSASTGAAAPSSQASASPPAAPSETKAAAPVSNGRPADPEAFWGDDVPKNHPIRQFAGWAKELDGEMVKWHDETLDEYSKDAEDVADKLLQRKLAALRHDADEETAPPARAAAPKPKTPKRRPPADDAPATSIPGIPNAGKLTPRGQVNNDRSHREITKDEAINGNHGLDPAAMRRRAMERFAARQRGELVDD
jgi:hypothetical protein